jgi:hypothetical protein
VTFGLTDFRGNFLRIDFETPNESSRWLRGSSHSLTATPSSPSPGAGSSRASEKTDAGASNPIHSRNHDRGILLFSNILLRPPIGLPTPYDPRDKPDRRPGSSFSTSHESASNPRNRACHHPASHCPDLCCDGSSNSLVEFLLNDESVKSLSSPPSAQRLFCLS